MTPQLHVLLGTKAQLIKMAPVMLELQRRELPYRFISTGQHRATMDDILEQFGLRPPDVVLHRGPEIDSLRRMGPWLARLSAKALLQKRQLFGDDPRGIVLVHGDTFSTLLGAMMGRLARLRVGHVESGLRSRDLFNPFPEEITRLAVFRLSHILYCPGKWACDNVAHLGRTVVDTKVNTVADALARVPGGEPASSGYGVVCLHRFENIFRKGALNSLMRQIQVVAERHRVQFVLHPATRARLAESGWLAKLEEHASIDVVGRMPYFDFVALLRAADFAVTDGGSIQEESSYLGLPCLLLRSATERREGLGDNVVLSAFSPEVIRAFVEDHARHRRPPVPAKVSAARIIVDHLAAELEVAGPPPHETEAQ